MNGRTFFQNPRKRRKSQHYYNIHFVYNTARERTDLSPVSKQLRPKGQIITCDGTHGSICWTLKAVHRWVRVPAGSPSRGRNVAIYVFDINQPSLCTPFLFCSCVCFCLYDPFNCISFHEFSRQLSTFSLCFSGLISALLVLLSCICLHESLPQP